MTHAVLTILMGVLLQPPATPATPAKPQPVPEPKPKSALWMDIAVERSVANHPDVRVAEARLMVAQAALDQAKLKVAIESRMNQAKYDQAKADVATKTKEFEQLAPLLKSGSVSASEHAKVLTELQAAKRQLAFAELLTQAAKEAVQAPKAVETIRGLEYAGVWRFDSTLNPQQPHSQSLLDLLQRKVKFAVKATDLDQTVIGVLERSMKEWDFAGAKQIVRYPHDTDPGVRSAYVMQPVEGENAIGVWLMMMLDDYNAPHEQPKGPAQGKYQIYVREYGLLFTLIKNAPDGVPTLAEFLRQPKK